MSREPPERVMGPFTPHLEPAAACEAALSALADSSNRLNSAAEAVEAPNAGEVLRELAADREDSRMMLVRVAVESGLDFDADQPGTLTGSIGDSWLQVEGALDGDAEVIASLRREEDGLVDALARLLEIDLPPEVEEVVRGAVARVAEGLERLDRLETD
ncbi:MAG: hypothetical protein WB239_10970 [Acidimicrobiia bacterium]